MATYGILDGPPAFNVQGFRSHTNDDLIKACHFAVRINPGFMVGNLTMPGGPGGTLVPDLTYLCETTELPGRALMNIDVRYYGPNQKLPIQTVYQDLSMTFICRNWSWEREFFDDWQGLINPINTFDFNYRDSYSTQIDMYQFRVTGEADYKWSLYNAYPLIVNAQPVAWSTNELQKLTVAFTYTHWSRPSDPLPGPPGPTLTTNSYYSG